MIMVVIIMIITIIILTTNNNDNDIDLQEWLRKHVAVLVLSLPNSTESSARRFIHKLFS